ncbi:DUF2911 domain-containing protein [Flavobacterium algicola]|uniref:DUF2911 domain-containing protein n=1 Tax=Flavobacterium algicola TaxID=556529 RepID=UPI001EFD328F|nr:DUF2911 domain-containing protein [Flavobacterium algicola]MCG9791872.1 DUF2911 domain-containing protein [Flavobacterium algicola]
MKKIKNSLCVAFLCMATVFSATAQEKKASPAEVAQGKINGAIVTINYSSPAVNERAIWGELVPFGKVWRAGANEATTIKTDKDLIVEGNKLTAGTYSVFVIPQLHEATVIFNKVAKQWGASKYDKAEDAFRVSVKPNARKLKAERLTYTISSNKIVLSWDYWDIPLSVK